MFGRIFYSAFTSDVHVIESQAPNLVQSCDFVNRTAWPQYILLIQSLIYSCTAENSTVISPIHSSH